MDISKLLKVFQSCKTEQQFNVALKYGNLLLRSTPKGVEYLPDNVAFCRALERIIGHTQGRLNVDI